MTTSTDFIWSRVRDVYTDKPRGAAAHLIDCNKDGVNRQTYCGKVTRVTPDAGLSRKNRCSACEKALAEQPVTVRT